MKMSASCSSERIAASGRVSSEVFRGQHGNLGQYVLYAHGKWGYELSIWQTDCHNREQFGQWVEHESRGEGS